MNGEGGWIKIHRDMLKNPWMLRPNVMAVWLYILLSVNYQPADVIFEGKRVTLQPGQGMFKFTKVAKELRVTVPTLYRVIDVLKSENQIEKQSSPRSTIITVVNWAKYQTNEKQNDEQMRNKRETNEKQMRNLPIIQRIEEGKKERNNNITNVMYVHQDDEPTKKSTEYQPIIDSWNSLPLTSIKRIQGKRLEQVRARVNDYGIDEVLNAISMVRRSTFLCGQNRKGWVATFDWFIKPNNFIKVLEGNYEDKNVNVPPSGKNDMRAGFEEAMSILGLEDNDGQ